MFVWPPERRPSLASPFPAGTTWMLAAPATSLLVPGEIDQGAPATESATADTAIELSTATSCLADTDVATARAYLDSTADAFVADTAASRQRNRHGDRLLDKVVARASTHRVNPRMRPWLQRRRQRRPPKWTMVGRRDIRRARPQSETSMPLKKPRRSGGNLSSAKVKENATWSDHRGRPRTCVFVSYSRSVQRVASSANLAEWQPRTRKTFGTCRATAFKPACSKSCR